MKQAWEGAVEEITTTLGCRFSRLKLKDKPFNVLNPVTDEEIDSLQRHWSELFPDLDLSKHLTVRRTKHGRVNMPGQEPIPSS